MTNFLCHFLPAVALLALCQAQRFPSTGVSPQVCARFRARGINLPGCNGQNGSGNNGQGQGAVPCPPNEIYRTCSTMCEPTCQSKVPLCPAVCGPPKCQCAPGLVRKNGRCVPSSQCNRNDRTPGLTCANMLCAPGTTCRMRTAPCLNPPCPQQATCEPTNGPPNRQCPQNEQFKQCSSMCEPTCSNRLPLACIESCGPPKCQCKPGFVRNEANGKCVRVARCGRNGNQNRQCSRNEEFKQCSSMCEPTCDNRLPLACIQMCGPPKCQCKSGFVRDQSANRCVRARACGRGNNQNTCANVDCRPGTVCRMRNGQPRCESATNNDACRTMNCPAGQVCVMQVVQCVRAPCPPVPQCVPKSRDDKCVLPCPPGMKCELMPVPTLVPCVPGNCPPPTPTCVPDNQGNGDPCATMLCGPGTKCRELPTGCPPGSVNCRRTATCVPDRNNNDNPCARMRCAAGTTCIVSMPMCLIPNDPNCKPRGNCMPNDRSGTNNLRCPNGMPPFKQFGKPMECAGGLCPAGYRCNQLDPIKNKSYCCPAPFGSNNGGNVCAATTCPVGHRCVEQTEACTSLSCRKVGKCVPGPNVFPPPRPIG